MSKNLIKEPKIKLEDINILDDPDFNNENIFIISGAGTGIGRATAIASAVNGIRTIGLDINEKELQKTQKQIYNLGHRMIAIKTDLNSHSDIEEAINSASKYGKIKYLANIAGIQHIDSIKNFPMDKFRQMQRIMLEAPFYLSQLVIPHMEKNNGGVIGNMGSIHSYICTKNKPAYNILKHGLLGLTKSISAEGEGKIRSFTICTGYVSTPLALNQIPAQAEQRKITEKQVVEDVMLGNSRIKEMMRSIDVGN